MTLNKRKLVMFRLLSPKSQQEKKQIASTTAGSGDSPRQRPWTWGDPKGIDTPSQQKTTQELVFGLQYKSKSIYKYPAGWWFQPIWNILVKLDIFPK